jgi:uncharacterized membrane protein YdbT with pleckstrin-like domain
MDFSSTTPATLILTVKPTRKNSFFILKSLGHTFWLFIVIGGFFGSMTIPLILSMIGMGDSLDGVMIGGILLFIIIWIFSFLFARMQLNNIEYRLYDTKIEFVDGFLVKSKKNIPYAKITNTEQGQSIMERIFGLGHILVDTAGTGGHELNMQYLDNSDDLYEKMNQIIHQGSK